MTQVGGILMQMRVLGSLRKGRNRTTLHEALAVPFFGSSSENFSSKRYETQHASRRGLAFVCARVLSWTSGVFVRLRVSALTQDISRTCGGSKDAGGGSEGDVFVNSRAFEAV